MTNVLQSQYNCRLNNIDIMIKQILAQKDYQIKINTYEKIRMNFPNKNIPNTLDLTNITHLWLLMGPNVRIYLNEFQLLKQNTKALKMLIDKSALIVNNILTETNIYKDPDVVIDQAIVDRLMIGYNELFKNNEQCHIIADEIIRLVSLFKNIFDYPNNFNNLNNEYRKIIDTEWFEILFYVYEKNGGTYPITCEKFIEHLKNVYPNMVNLHATEVVNIIDHHLGGLGAKTYLDVSKNLESWIRRNYDCVGSFICNKIILGSNSIQFL